jgi:hypothetical protein
MNGTISSGQKLIQAIEEKKLDTNAGESLSSLIQLDSVTTGTLTW